MVPDKFVVPGRSANLDYSRARACITCGCELFRHFFFHLSFLFFLPVPGRRPDID